MKPSLPQNETSREDRQDALRKARETYNYNTDYHDILLAEHVPSSDDYTLPYIAEVIGLKALFKANLVVGGPGWSGMKALKELVDADPGQVVDTFQELWEEAIDGSLAMRAKGYEDYDDMFSVIQKPEIANRWREDRFFAWQRLTGGNPTVIERMDAIPSKFPLTEAHYQRALCGQDTLAAALAEGRLFVTDFEILDKTPTGETTGFKKYLWAPIAAFAQAPWGEFVPVAIQCEQTPGPDNPIYTPQDGLRWEMAKTVLQVADVNWKGTTVHLGYCHLVMEAVILTSHRELAPNHPLMLLLHPHFQMTLTVNRTARTGLINPGGYMDLLQSGTLEGSLGILKRGMAKLSLRKYGPWGDLKERGVDDTEALPVYPYRDDALPTARALRKWVDGYLRLYYHSNQDVLDDKELSAWQEMLGSDDGGRLVDVPELRNFEALVDFVTHILFRCTSYHSAINYSGWEHAGYAPNMPTAAFGPGPSPHKEPTEADLLNMMPPLNVARGAFTLMYQLYETRHNQIGHYPRGHFEDSRVKPLLKALQKDLEEVEDEIKARNKARYLPYERLLPSLVPLSIHV